MTSPLPDAAWLWTLVLVGLWACLLGALLIATRWPWWLKASAIALSAAMAPAMYTAFEAATGWPTRDAMPERFVLLSAVFDEPKPQKGHPGAIYVWVHPFDGDTLAAYPRSVALPYAPDLRQLFEDGLKKNRSGNTQIGQASPMRGSGGFAWLRPPGTDPLQIKLSDLPRAQLPDK